MAPIGLYVQFTAKPGQRVALAQTLLAASRLVEGAPGCVLYLVNTSPSEAEVV